MVSNRPAGAFVAGVILMGLGGLFLIAQLLGGTFWAYFWPYPIIAAGLTFFIAMITGGRGSGAFAIPGSILTTLGIILFLQNTFGWWESWTFAWTLVVMSVGVGLYLMGVWNENEKVKRVGVYIAAIGGLMLLLFGAFFGIGYSWLGFGFAARILWPLILIGVGAVLVMRGGKVLNKRSISANQEPSMPAPQPSPKVEEPVQSVTA